MHIENVATKWSNISWGHPCSPSFLRFSFFALPESRCIQCNCAPMRCIATILHQFYVRFSLVTHILKSLCMYTNLHPPARECRRSTFHTSKEIFRATDSYSSFLNPGNPLLCQCSSSCGNSWLTEIYVSFCAETNNKLNYLSGLLCSNSMCPPRRRNSCLEQRWSSNIWMSNQFKEPLFQLQLWNALCFAHAHSSIGLWDLFDLLFFHPPSHYSLCSRVLYHCILFHFVDNINCKNLNKKVISVCLLFRFSSLFLGNLDTKFFESLINDQFIATGEPFRLPSVWRLPEKAGQTFYKGTGT